MSLSTRRFGKNVRCPLLPGNIAIASPTVVTHVKVAALARVGTAGRGATQLGGIVPRGLGKVANLPTGIGFGLGQVVFVIPPTL